jgi:putative ABC transport system permease protein
MNPAPIVVAMLRRHVAICAMFALLIALAVGLGGVLTAQERALRQGSARAADRFDIVVAAPGSHTDLLLKVVFLQPGSVELLSGPPLRRLLAETRAEFVAPVGFGDSYLGSPVVGTIAALVTHLAGGSLEGRMFEGVQEAVAGADVPLAIGDTFEAAHGEDAGPEADHHPQALTVVGRMPPTGTPWDRAILVPIEFVWQVHGLGTGHAEGEHAGEGHAEEEHADEDHADEVSGPEEHGEDHDHAEVHETRIGPPFDAPEVPGIPAAIVKPATLAAAYGLRGEWRTPETTAFFPAEVLVALYELIGDVRVVMSIMAIATQALLVAAILTAIVLLMQLYRRRFAILRALGAPPRYVFAVVWVFSFTLIAAGCLAGLLVAWASAGAVSAFFSEATGMALEARLGWPEIRLAGAIALLGALLAALPALFLYRQPVAATLRSA